jgi:beta-lactamase regulating signal transducer with metallopeptidase domain
MLSDFLASHPSIQAALPILIDAALKGAILVAIAAIAAFLLRNRSAASRHAAWTAAVIGHLAIPALVLLLPAWKMPLLPAASWMATQSTAITPAPAIPAIDATVLGKQTPPTAAAGNASSANTPGPDSRRGAVVSSGPGNPTTVSAGSATTTSGSARRGIVPIIAAIWLVGMLLVLLRLAFGTWRVGQLARDGARVEDGMWLSLTQRLANRLGVTRPLILLRGERLAVPVTWGIVYPAVLLPQDADTWSEERRRFVLVHEMAHVKRFDALTQLLAQISVAVFWFDPLVWLAAHRMRVEREHACDDYVLRDGTAPSLYAGELLEMVRSIGMPSHDRAAPAFAALAMARRSEFEGRMLAILDPRLDRHTLTRRGTLMTAVVVALLTLPLAALRPFQPPTPATPVGASSPAFGTAPTSATAPASATEAVPESFKVSISEPVAASASASTASEVVAGAEPVTPASNPRVTQVTATWSCDTQPRFTRGTGTHVSHHNDGGVGQILNYMVTTGNRCAEAAVVGRVKFSPDETRIAEINLGGFARFRERTETFDRAVSVTPLGDGALSFTALVDGRTVPFDGAMQAWLARLLPEVLREAAINVPDRVARFRAEGGVSAVLQEIGRIKSSGSKRAHYQELIKTGPMLTASETERLAQQAARDLTSSGDLSAVIQKLPKSSLRNSQTRQAVAGALSQIKSSGDRTNTLQVLAPNADPELLVMLAKAAETLPSSGDKANFLMATASEYLTPGIAALRNAFFKTTSTLQSSGDMANVLISSIPYGHSSPQVILDVVETSKDLASSGDAANVLLSLISQRAVQPGNTRGTLAVIERTLTMASSGDRANVLISLATKNLLSNSELRDAFTKAAMVLPSDGDRANVLAAAARR